MRLSIDQQKTIKDAVLNEFGEDAKVWLFGSRVDDSLKGGDIDLYVEANKALDDVLSAEMRLYANLISELGDQRIDIVVRQPSSQILEIHRQALKNGIEL